MVHRGHPRNTKTATGGHIDCSGLSGQPVGRADGGAGSERTRRYLAAIHNPHAAHPATTGTRAHGLEHHALLASTRGTRTIGELKHTGNSLAELCEGRCSRTGVMQAVEV